jgi:hypothetical protein
MQLPNNTIRTRTVTVVDVRKQVGPELQHLAVRLEVAVETTWEGGGATPPPLPTPTPHPPPHNPSPAPRMKLVP